MNEITYIDLLLYSEEDIKSFEILADKHNSNLNYLPHLPKHFKIEAIQCAGFSQRLIIDRILYNVVNKKNGKWNLNLFLFFHIRKQKPDVILVHSMIYAWQIVILAKIIGPSCKIIVQNHAEQPFGIKKRWIQKIADRFISAYLFVSKEQALPWIEKGIIKQQNKVYEVMEGSTDFEPKEKVFLKEKWNCSDKTVFLWVGRLDKNKDPIAVLKAFARYVKLNPNARLWMIYHTTELLNEIKILISENAISAFVELIGKIEHEKMVDYYNVADYFILGSHYEGSGYALCEAMACGCVPIVTKIPSFKNMLNDGQCGYLFEPGNEQELYEKLSSLKESELEKDRQKVLVKFQKDLSFEAIGKKITDVIFDLTAGNNS